MKIKLKQKTMKKIVKLTERDLTRLVKRTINEMDENMSAEEYREALEDVMGQFYYDFESMSNPYLMSVHQMAKDIEDIENLDVEDKLELLDQIQEFYDDLDILAEKYYQFRKNARR